MVPWDQRVNRVGFTTLFQKGCNIFIFVSGSGGQGVYSEEVLRFISMQVAYFADFFLLCISRCYFQVFLVRISRCHIAFPCFFWVL